MQNILRIALVVMTCLAVGYLTGMLSYGEITTWYSTLVKPVFNPPNWVFTPVWSLLYVTMGVAGGIIWNRIECYESDVKKAFQFFIFQLALNALWSYLFFGLHNPLLALIEIILLWLVTFECYTSFRQIDKIAGMLLLPYLVWVSFSAILNGSIWWLNR